jgi:hypothetical protein
MATVREQGPESQEDYPVKIDDPMMDGKAANEAALDDVAHHHDTNRDQEAAPTGEEMQPLTETVQGAMMALQTRQTEINAKVGLHTP